MSTTDTTTAVRYSVDKINGQWAVVQINPDGTRTTITFTTSRAQARETAAQMREQVEAPDVDPSETPAGIAPDGLGAREDTPEDVAAWQAQMDEEDDGTACAGCGEDVTEEDGCTGCNAEPTPEPEAPAKPEATGESVLARKMQPEQRIVLRGVGTVTVSSVSKVKGVQKVLVGYRAEDGTDGERELWVNSKYRLVR